MRGRRSSKGPQAGPAAPHPELVRPDGQVHEGDHRPIGRSAHDAVSLHLAMVSNMCINLSVKHTHINVIFTHKFKCIHRYIDTHTYICLGTFSMASRHLSQARLAHFSLGSNVQYIKQ